MPDASPLGKILAQQIECNTSPWLARYLFTRFPSEAVKNASLPREMVDDIISSPQCGLYGVALADLHELSREQFLAVVYAAPERQRVFPWKSQRTHTSHDLLEYIEWSSDIELASWAIENSEWSHFDEFSQEEQERIVALATPRAHVVWLAQRTSLSDTDLAKVAAWDVPDIGHYRQAFETLVENHTEHLHRFVAMESLALRYVLAGSQHLHDEEHQREVARLGDEPLPAHYNAVWLEENSEVVVQLAWNPRTRPSVLRELQRRVNSATLASVSTVGTAIDGKAIQQILDTRKGANNRWRSTQKPYQQITDPGTLEWILDCLDAKFVNLDHLARVAKDLAENPNLSSDQRNKVNDVLTAMSLHIYRAVTPVEETRARIAQERSREPFPRETELATFVKVAKQQRSLPHKTSRYFLAKMGERQEAWDTLIALSTSWDGTVAGLVETVQNLL